MTESAMPQALLDAVRTRVAKEGIEGLSLRAVTAAVGKSTTAVFNLFGSKDGLLRASMEDALAKDRAFHQELLQSLQGVPLDSAVLVDLIALYVSSRFDQENARLWLEALYKSRQFPDMRDLTHQWHSMRLEFWKALLHPTPYVCLASLLPSYTVAEESYAAALSALPGYTLVLRDTIRHLLEGFQNSEVSDAPKGVLSSWLQHKAVLDPAVMKSVPAGLERLLDAAVKHVEQEGAAGLNLKEVAGETQTPPSQIVYHFGDFAAFRNMVIWNALMRGLPDYLNSAATQEKRRPPERDWLSELEHMVVATVTAATVATAATAATNGGSPNTNSSGYYVNYARILGQACLSARRDHQLQPLILHLRAIEGRGIHRATQTDWPENRRLNRDRSTAFAIWIKGHAILNEALGRSRSDLAIEESIETAASVLSSGTPAT